MAPDHRALRRISLSDRGWNCARSFFLTPAGKKVMHEDSVVNEGEVLPAAIVALSSETGGGRG